MNKLKIINDPVYGFITLPNTLVFDLIEHPWFQRLRYIRQLGMTHLVYPGALHTRFHHALGAMHLMATTLEELKAKGNPITDAECQGAIAAILLHDIGHGPFSHALEHSLAENIHHEDLSLMLMEKMNKQMDGRLSLAIEIFTNRYQVLIIDISPTLFQKHSSPKLPRNYSCCACQTTCPPSASLSRACSPSSMTWAVWPKQARCRAENTMPSA
jgi:HD superfamily phosphohydrolase